MKFDRYIGIDYSGAETPTSSLKGLRVFEADGTAPPVEVPPPPSPRKYWTRRGLAEWLARRLVQDRQVLVGIDHAFSFPMQYFVTHQLPLDWTTFLDDFHRHWPADEEHIYVDFIRDGAHGNAADRGGDARWRRLTDVRAGAKSVFHFDVPGSVAKATHAGLPWLRFLRQQAGDCLWFWPFDGWTVPDDCSCILEVYPSLWSRGFPTEGRDSHQHDAYAVAEWMRSADRDGRLRASSPRH